MTEKKSRIRPLSLIFALLGLAASVCFILFLWKTGFVPAKLTYAVTIALAVLNLICILIAIAAGRKWVCFFTERPILHGNKEFPQLLMELIELHGCDF